MLSFNLKTAPAPGFPPGEKIRIKVVPLEAAPEREKPEELLTFSGSAGESFDFAPEETLSGRPIELRVEFSRGAFHRPLSHSELEKGQKKLKLPPYEKSAEETLEVVSHEVSYRPDTDSLAVREKIQLTNPGSGLVGGPEAPITFNLPAAAAGLRFGPGAFLPDDVALNGGRLKYRLFVAPGRTVFGFYYRLPVSKLPLRLRRKVTLPTQKFSVSVPALQGLELSSEELARKSDAEGVINLRARELAPGEKVDLVWKNLGERSSTRAVTSPGTGGRNSASSTRRIYSYIFWAAAVTLLLSLLCLIYFVVNYIFRATAPRKKLVSFVESEIVRLESAVDRGELDESVKDEIVRRWKKFCREELQ